MREYEESLRAREGGKVLPKPGPLPEPDVCTMQVLYCPISVLSLYLAAVVSPELFNEPELSTQFCCYKLSAITYLIAKFYNHLFPLTSKKFIK